MALYPALISGQARIGKSWRGSRAKDSAAPVDTAVVAERPAVDLNADLGALARLSQRVATLFGTASVAVLWAAEWLSSTARTAPMPAIAVGVATALLGVLFAIVALLLEVLTRVRVVQSPQLTTLAEHRERIAAESAAFRESLPAVDPREERRQTRRRRFRR